MSQSKMAQAGWQEMKEVDICPRPASVYLNDDNIFKNVMLQGHGKIEGTDFVAKIGTWLTVSQEDLKRQRMLRNL